MSSEIRAGNSRVYWIISDGNNYIDGITDPGLVTTVGNGWYLNWIGDNYNEYLNTCNSINILPRISNPNISSSSPLPNSRLSARQVRLWLINKGIDLDYIPIIIDNGISDPTIRKIVKVEWEYAPYVEYSHHWLLPLASGLGLTKTDIDEAFSYAKDL